MGTTRVWRFAEALAVLIDRGIAVSKRPPESGEESDSRRRLHSCSKKKTWSGCSADWQALGTQLKVANGGSGNSDRSGRPIMSGNTEGSVLIAAALAWLARMSQTTRTVTASAICDSLRAQKLFRPTASGDWKAATWGRNTGGGEIRL